MANSRLGARNVRSIPETSFRPIYALDGHKEEFATRLPESACKKGE
jgi:hypothetical protein